MNHKPDTPVSDASSSVASSFRTPHVRLGPVPQPSSCPIWRVQVRERTGTSSRLILRRQSIPNPPRMNSRAMSLEQFIQWQDLLQPASAMPVSLQEKRLWLHRCTPRFACSRLQSLVDELTEDPAYVEAYAQRLPGTTLLCAPAPHHTVLWVPAGALAGYTAQRAQTLAGSGEAAELARLAAWLGWRGSFEWALHRSDYPAIQVPDSVTHPPPYLHLHTNHAHDLRQCLIQPLLTKLAQWQPAHAWMLAQLWHVPPEHIGLAPEQPTPPYEQRLRIMFATAAAVMAQAHGQQRWKDLLQVCVPRPSSERASCQTHKAAQRGTEGL